MKNRKVLIVGAGVAGPALCYWLNRHGFSPSLVEKSKSLRCGGYAIDIRGIAVEVVQEMGLYSTLVERRKVTVEGQHVDRDGHVFLTQEGEAFGFRQGEDVEIVRGDLVEILMEAISGLPCHFDRQIRSIKSGDEGVEVLFEGGSCEVYDLLIGADGMHSFVRQAAFDPSSYQMRHLNHFISVFSVPNYLNLDEREISYEEGPRSVTLHAQAGSDRALSGWMFPSYLGECFSRNPQEQKALLKSVFQGGGWEVSRLLKEMERSEDFYFDSISQVLMDQWTNGRVALIGDAGYCASPLSGQGTSLALVGAYTLANELKRFQGDHFLAFDAYNKWMRPFVEANQNLGKWVSENYLSEESRSEEQTEKRNEELLFRVKQAAESVSLKKGV